MKYVNNLPHLSTVLCSMMLLLSLAACSNDTKSSVNGHQEWADGIKAVVYIESPKVGTLMNLRGIAGKGVIVVKNDKQSAGQAACLSSPIRLAAGDFGGDSIGFQKAEPIRLYIYSNKVMAELMAGDEIVSEDYLITDQRDPNDGDIKIDSGLTLSYGFVLNPGEWSWSSVFGHDYVEEGCGLLNGLEL